MYNGKIIVRVDGIAAACFFLICFFKSFWYIEAVNILLRLLMFFGAILAFFTSRLGSFKNVSLIELIWILVLGVPILGRVFTAFSGNSMSETISIVMLYACSTLYALACARNKRLINASIKICVVYLAVLVCCTIIFRFTPGFYTSRIVPLFNRDANLIRGYLGGNMSGLTAHYSTNGMYMALAAIVGFCYVFTADDSVRRIEKAGRYTWLIVSLIALLMTGKRAHLIFVLMSAVICYFYYHVDKPKGRLFKMVAICAFGGFAFYIAYLLMPNYFSAITRIIGKLDSDDVSAGRLELWETAIAYFKQYPLVGIGFKQFIRSVGLDVHNIYLQILCEMGILGAVVYYSVLFATFRKSFRNLVYARKNRLYDPKEIEDGFLLAFSFMYQVFFLIYGLTGNPLYDVPTFVPYYFSLGIAVFYCNDIRERKRKGE